MSIRHHLAAVCLLGASAALASACGSSAGADPSGERVSTAAAAITDELAAFAATCDATMGSGATVPPFDCDVDGIELPVTLNGHPFRLNVDTQCDRPNMFEGDCMPHNKLVPLASTATATTVAICRTFVAPSGGFTSTSGYDEIDVIQYNKQTGDTCFYTTTGKLPDGGFRPFGSIPGNAPPPSAGVGTIAAATGAFPFWQTPSLLAVDRASQCVSCHDNGPFIRSPFVKQVEFSLPASIRADLGFGNDNFNLTQPYRIDGQVFANANWRAVSISLANGDTTCTSCHRMGVSSLFLGGGTSIDFGPTSVGCYGNQEPNCDLYNGPNDFIPQAQNPAAPHWMIPGHRSFSPTFLNVAHEIQTCAMAWQQANKTSPPGALPASCVAEPLTDLCENASQCTGVLPNICKKCSDGTIGCAHHVCGANHLCDVATCD